MKQESVICVVGLGYVGLPLAHAFGRTKWKTYGYDIDATRIEELTEGRDRTRELSEKQMKETKITYSTDPTCIAQANVVILAIPTPVDEKNRPDLSLIMSATETVGKHLRRGSIVVYESTVYPGVTEELCGPILEKQSGLKRGKDFTLGYSPERVNPGDKEHTIQKIVKVVAGEDAETTEFLAELYGMIVQAGVHRASSIKVAEMAKAIENAQRDLNIAYVNEIAIMCNALGIATKDVLAAAGTKWNFLRFTPGLVGGHCIGVDPYYLLEKAKSLGIALPLIASSRTINDGMVSYVARHVLRVLEQQGKKPRGATILVLGLTFKEDIPDTRNSKSKELAGHLRGKGCTVATHDPYVAENDALTKERVYDAILLLVPHREYRGLQAKDFATMGKPDCIFYDLQSVFQKEEFEKLGMTYLAL